ncbi:AraC family transcriptional regulator [Paraburkholderia caballeronis]|uniref:AraC-type DNA-binding protein n=1 Tax=Paraburkholderia caballeronis TaxID=416943 RepID=A0A1H7UH98_9BURK|nr:AraC family transcriptional regulator [Paraburkholderia caballeronis]PXW17523.1 AraC family transcriptional regulator [Paraburkholderia caballeronis]PXW95112.1 AraC family transcriptional regulator [Paraburkholderia caballeronis]RAJ90958.1 AraC family transcriptional regulator [Paraburkholderia caballeronis]TDV07823.1 AraC family transcriptional regulator [Paraburkholderia caballeronis]TDV11186.1 AraC family transcriptional regulator [Paraburkholderia caballeronis]
MSDALLDLVRRHTRAGAAASPFVTPVAGLTLLRSDHEKLASHAIFKPALCVVAQGAKWTTFGGRRVDYRAGDALVVSVEMPAFSRIVEASPTEPFLGVVIEFDVTAMRDVLNALDDPPQPADGAGRGVFVTGFDGPLADCVLRMVRLLDTPHAIPVLAPMIMRELCYWLLTGPHGGDVVALALAGSHVPRVVSAIHALRDRFAQTIRVEDLATIAQMSPSAFHRQFKALTSMTPMQYQKQLRLLEARHLMVTGAANAETAAFQVGYESPSQFSREYARMFGSSPRRDIAALRAAATP